MQLKLAIIGASYLQKPLVQKAKELGYYTICFAWEEGAVCKELCDEFHAISIAEKEQILEICEELKINAVLSIGSDLAVITVNYIANQMNLIGNSIKSSEISTNKYLMREALKDAGCLVPFFQLIKKQDAIPKVNRFPLIVKPVDRSGSKGVFLVNTESELENAITIAKQESFVGAAILEQYIDGHEVSVETISWNGKHYLLAITDKVTSGPPNFVELEHHQPSKLTNDLQSKIRILAFDALDSLKLKYGAGHTEIKINGNGELYLIELGARMGGDFIGSHLVQLSTGYDFLKGVIEIALNDFNLPKFLCQKASGVYFLSQETKNIMPFFQKNNDFDVEKKISDESLHMLENSNDRSGYLIYQFSDRVIL